MKADAKLALINGAGHALFLMFATVILVNATQVSMSYDDSFNASVAKNLALGFSYVSSYDTITPFDPYVTTGPPSLLPVALTVRIFGNTPWAPNVATAIVTLAMLVLVLHFASRRLRISYGLLALSCIPAIALLTQLVDGWNRLRGDILAGELVVLGALILPFGPSSDGRSTSLRQVFVAGLVLGLAALTKFLAFACVAGVSILFFLSLIVRPNRNYRDMAAAIVVLAGGVLIPIALFEIVRLVALHGFRGYLANLQTTLVTNAVQEPSIAKILLGQFDFAERFRRIPDALKAWGNYVGFARHPIAYWLLVLGWVASSVAGFFAATATNRYRLIALAGAGGGLMVLFVILFIPEFAERVQLGAIVFSLFVGMATAQWANAVLANSEDVSLKSPSGWLPVLPLTLAAAFSVFWVLSFSKDSRHEWETQRASVASASAAVLSIRADHPGATFCGLGWLVPRVLEYALPGAGWFRDCELKPEDSMTTVSSDTYLVREPWAYAWLGTAAHKEFASQCDRNLVYKDDNFIVSRCPAGLRRPQAAKKII